MKKLIPFLVVLTLVLGAFFLGTRNVKVVSAGTETCDDHKVMICHDNNGAKDYVSECVDKNSTAGGHDDHTNDVIPSYTYQVWEKTGTRLVCPNNYSPSSLTCPGKCEKDSQPTDSSKCTDFISEDVFDWVTYTFNAQGDQSILAAGCRLAASPTPSPTFSPTPIPPSPSVSPTPIVSPTPTPSGSNEPTFSPTPIPSVNPTPTETPFTPPSCGADEHLDLSGTKCLKWELGGPQAPPPVGSVLGMSAAQVLGASTMAGTGVVDETIFNLIFVLGSGLTAFGLRKLRKIAI